MAGRRLFLLALAWSVARLGRGLLALKADVLLSQAVHAVIVAGEVSAQQAPSDLLQNLFAAFQRGDLGLGLVHLRGVLRSTRNLVVHDVDDLPRRRLLARQLLHLFVLRPRPSPASTLLLKGVQELRRDHELADHDLEQLLNAGKPLLQKQRQQRRWDGQRIPWQVELLPRQNPAGEALEAVQFVRVGRSLEAQPMRRRVNAPGEGNGRRVADADVGHRLGRVKDLAGQAQIQIVVHLLEGRHAAVLGVNCVEGKPAELVGNEEL
mmetsp:Transcript_16749/g.31408  ORF Transcript_16749/g.31408 Transcript_16749/m.31408 type:complete len:265 (+) Transcript_16749:2577-3371(+)